MKNRFSLATAIIMSMLTLGLSPLRAATYYWVGGTGVWSDYSNHWATSSGGTVFHTQMPGAADDVVFDANSFDSNLQTVWIDQPSLSIKSFSSINIDDTVTLDLSNYLFPFVLNCYGDFQNSSQMRTGVYLFLKINIVATGGTVNMAIGRNTWGEVYINTPANVNWTDDTLRLHSVQLDRGSLNLDVNFMRVENYFNIAGENTRPRVNMKSSHIEVESVYIFSRGLYFDGDSCTLGIAQFFTANFSSISTINHVYTFKNNNHTQGSVVYFDLSNAIVNELVVNKETIMSLGLTTFNHILSLSTLTIQETYVSGAKIGKVDVRSIFNINTNFTIDTLLLNNSSGITQIQNGLTLTVKDIIAQGTCSSPLIIQTVARPYFYNYTSYISTPNTAYINSQSSVINVSGITLRGISATGSAVFNATNALLIGLCNGWNLISTQQQQNLYWIGGGGSWLDPAHWSLTSGGPPSLCLPGLQDNVFFDSNSGLTTDTVFLPSSGVRCHNITVNAQNSNPVFFGNPLEDRLLFNSSSIILISGSINVLSPAKWKFDGKVSFVGGERGLTINPGGFIFYELDFNQEGAEWLLTDSLLFSRQCIIYRGTLVSNSNFIGSTFQSYPRMEILGDTVILGQSEIFLPGGDLVVNPIQDPLVKIEANNATASCMNITNYGIDFDKLILSGGFLNSAYSFAYFSSNHFNTLICESVVNLSSFDTLDVDRLICKTTVTLPLKFTVDYAEFQSNVDIGADFSFDTLYFNNPGSNTSLPAGLTINANTLVASTCSALGPNIYSSSSGTQSNIIVPSGTVCMDYCTITDINASGGATFNVGAGSIDNGNNSGLTFASCGNVNLLETVPPYLEQRPDENLYTCYDNDYFSWNANATDNCGIDTIIFNPGPGHRFSPGNTTVTYTAIDNSGNSTTKSFTVHASYSFDMTTDITELPYTTCAFGQNAHIIIGYGNGSPTVFLNPFYESGFIYETSWSPQSYLSDPYSPSTTFTPPVLPVGSCSSYTYTLTATDAISGCIDTTSVTINVVDVTTNNPNKVRMCVNGNNQTVPLNLVPQRLAQGNCLGWCSSSCSSFARVANMTNEETIDAAGDVQVVPNPNNGVFAVNITPAQTQETCVIQVFDLTGKQVHSQTLFGSEMISTSVDLSTLGAGIYMLRVTNGDFAYTQKVIVNGN
ncbi:MAG: T9SS type A sorting domain-containing protein [Bacteroidia bacterium]|jgi:hypothetical protein|nr:T9SS type A sorting domain-containing protein [Bacteroidia bacterium]